MRVETTALPDVVLITPRVFADERGAFFESWNDRRYAHAGVGGPFVQDNVSSSRAGVLRGLHLQHPNAQGKLVSVLDGAVFDVAVDVRAGSPSFGRWVGVHLDADSRQQLYIPPGFAHGFQVVSESALFMYKCTAEYDAAAELTIAWDDPDLAIDWPSPAPRLSAKDACGVHLATLVRTGRLAR